MKGKTQLERYRLLLSFIDENLKEDIDIPAIEAACNYSYRNINRIFEALQHETIGRHIKRVRLERAAQFLKYTRYAISDIAFEVGYSDVAALSNAFKKHFNCSPSAFRESGKALHDMIADSYKNDAMGTDFHLEYEVERLPDFLMLGLEYKGSYKDTNAIRSTWEYFISYAQDKNLLSANTVYLAEILDDNDISETIHCRYNLGIALEKELEFDTEGLFRVKRVGGSNYIKFLHKGSHESSADTYNTIYAHWLGYIPYEMKDAPVLEFFLNDESEVPESELLTEIYIPIQ